MFFLIQKEHENLSLDNRILFELIQQEKYLHTYKNVNDVLENLPYLFSNSYIQSKLLCIPKDNVFFEQFDGYLGEISNKNLNFLKSEVRKMKNK